MLSNDQLAARQQASLPARAGACSAVRFEVDACVGSLALAIVASLFAPLAGQLIALFACMLCAAYARKLLPFAILAYAHAGAVVVASRALNAESSDFVVYFDLFSGICSNTVGLVDSLFAFGPEFGLPLLYNLTPVVGGCGLSINGLAYVQTVFVSFVALSLLCSYAIRDRSAFQAAIVVGGTLALFSFVYVTQLSRQMLSSIFVLAALLYNGRRSTSWGLVVLATMFHLSGPIIFGIAVMLRSASRFALVGTCLTIVALLSAVPLLLTWGLENADAFAGLAKLMYYSGGMENGPRVESDYRALLFLVAAGLVSIPLSKGSRHLAMPDARLLLGLALLAYAVLDLPLAATRMTLAFSAIGIGYFLFKGLVANYPRLSMLALFLAILLRSGIFNFFGPPDQPLWQAYARFSIYPLYYGAAYSPW